MKVKTRITRLWSILLALVMAAALLPTEAMAAGAATEKADFSTDPGTALSLLNAAKTGTEDSTWDPGTNTLTLNGVNFTTTASTAVKLPEAATIVLNGDNIITSGEATSKDSFGIYALGDLTINGAGKLTVTSGTANDDSHGIYACDKMSITGNVTATSGTANDSCYGIHAGDSIAISGNVTAIGGGAGEYSHGIYADNNLTIEGGNVTAAGGTAINENSYGIYAYCDINISGGTVIATGGAADSYSLGIYAEENMFVSGTADVTAEGGSAAESDSNGICASYDVTITGGSVKATGGTANSWSVGISADSGAVIISGGTVKAEGGEAANSDSIGIYADDSVTITGGTLIAKAADRALYEAPSELPGAYRWRISNSGDYSAFPGSVYSWDGSHTYLEIREPSYTITFDANGGTGEMEAATGVLGEYTLPANGFTAPEDKQFKGWATSADGAVFTDAAITVSADTVLYAIWEDIPADPIEYDILDGEDSKWKQDSDKSLSIKGSGAFSDFVGVKVDGTLIDAENYTVKEGSTIVKLKADYLNTLSKGSHDIELLWKDGSASTTFTVQAKTSGDNDTQSSQPGSSRLWILVALLVVIGAGGLGIVLIYKKKKKS